MSGLRPSGQGMRARPHTADGDKGGVFPKEWTFSSMSHPGRTVPGQEMRT